MMPSQPRCFRCLRHAVLLAALWMVACPSVAPPEAAVAPRTAKSATAKVPLAPARWGWVQGATQAGPTVAEGTLALLGGRRVLVERDGTARTETVAAPEPLLGMIAVPVAGGERRIVAYSAHGIYRLDSLLGEPVTLAHTEKDATVEKIGAGPGVVALWTFGSEAPRFVDVTTGQSTTLPQVPPLLVRRIAFRSMQEGACLFDAAGLMLTKDGGKTWTAAGETNKGDAQRVSELVIRGDTVIGRWTSDTRVRMSAPFDLSAGRVGPSGEETPPENEPDVLRWIRRTGMDPLAVAAGRGVIFPTGEALVAAEGLVARVDLQTGLVSNVVEVGGPGAGESPLVRGGATAWMGAPLPGSETGNRPAEKLGVFPVTVQGGRIQVDSPVLRRTAQPVIQAAPSGAVMVRGSCEPGRERGGVCVRQADGTWKSVRPEVRDLDLQGAGPLKSGKVAFLRGLDPNQIPPRDVAPRPGDTFPPPEPEDEPPWEDKLPPGVSSTGDKDAGVADKDAEAPSGHRDIWVVTMSPDGDETTIATVPWPRRASPRVQGFIEEAQDGSLRFVLDHTMVVVAPGSRIAETHDVEGASWVALHGDRGVALLGDRLRSTTDGGATWSEVPGLRAFIDIRLRRNRDWDDTGGPGWGRPSPDLPETVEGLFGRADWLPRVEGGSAVRPPVPAERRLPFDSYSSSTPRFSAWSPSRRPPPPVSFREALDLSRLLVSDAGLLLEPVLRIGWGAPGPLPEEGRPQGGSVLPDPVSETDSPPHAITWTPAGPGKKDRLVESSQRLFEAVVQGAPARGTRREIGSVWRRSVLDPIGVMFVEGQGSPAEAAGGPGDPSEVAGGPPDPSAARSFSLPQRWFFSWLDPAERGGKPRSVTVAAPRGMGDTELSWDTDLRGLATSGGEALFWFESGVMVRANAAGIRTSRVPAEWMPVRNAVVGSGSGDPAAWMTESGQIVAWPAGEGHKPRVIATLRTDARALLGEPTREGIPVMLLSPNEGFVKTLAIPGGTLPHPSTVWLDGWAPFPSFLGRVDRLPACANGQGGHLARVNTPCWDLNVGRRVVFCESVAELRVSGQGACIAGAFHLFVTYDRNNNRNPYGLRYNLTDGHGEFLALNQSMRKVLCKWEPVSP